jgi:hypothetical protein
LEATNTELKNDLRDLYITSAQEIDVSSSRKAIVIHVRPAAHFPRSRARPAWCHTRPPIHLAPATLLGPRFTAVKASTARPSDHMPPHHVLEAEGADIVAASNRRLQYCGGYHPS